jgi:hypothetical protein
MAATHSEAWLRQQCSVGSASQNRAQKPAANGCGARRKEVRRALRLGVVILGFIDFASIYFNGLLAILFVFVVPGVVFVRFFDIPSFPQRWFVVFLSSLTANHLFVTLIAALHLSPLHAYRAAAAALIVFNALARLKSNLTIPFRIMVFAGLVLAPFLPRIRWLALPLFIGFWLWADTASYDLRNLLGLLLISASIPLYALARRLPVKSAAASNPRWNVPDAADAGGLAAMAVGLTLTLAQNDTQLKERFATDQLRGGPGFELNQSIAKLLQRGCAIFSADGYIATISALQPFRSQMRFFFFTEPLNDALVNRFNETTGCTSIFYPPERTHPSILRFIAGYAEARGLKKTIEVNGMELLASSP